MKKGKIIACALAILSAIFTFSPAKAAQNLLIGGGAVNGVYYFAALQICDLVNSYGGDDYHCVGVPSPGSVFNVNYVDRGPLDFGIVQSDRIWQAWEGEENWESRPVESLRIVFRLHLESVLLVTRADSGIDSVGDLRGKRVNIGNPGSGHRGNAEDVLGIYGIDPEKDIEAQWLQQSEASRALIDDKIDAFFYTVGNPNAAIEEPANSTDIDIISINSDEIMKLADDMPYYTMTTIPAKTYTGVDTSVETYATYATLVTNTDASEKMVYELVKAVFEHLKELKGAHDALRSLEAARMLPERMLEDFPPLHPGAERYYREQGWH